MNHEADDGDKVQLAKGRTLYEMVVKILGRILGKWMAGGFKVGESLIAELFQRNNEVEENG